MGTVWAGESGPDSLAQPVPAACRAGSKTPWRSASGAATFASRKYSPNPAVYGKNFPGNISHRIRPEPPVRTAYPGLGYRHTRADCRHRLGDGMFWRPRGQETAIGVVWGSRRRPSTAQFDGENACRIVLEGICEPIRSHTAAWVIRSGPILPAFDFHAPISRYCWA